MSFPRVLAESGLTKIEIASLYGTSRQTVHAWAAGRVPHEKVEHSRSVAIYPLRRFTLITQALLTAIDRRVLPMEAMDRAARKERIAKLAARLQGLKPA